MRGFSARIHYMSFSIKTGNKDVFMTKTLETEEPQGFSLVYQWQMNPEMCFQIADSSARSLCTTFILKGGATDSLSALSVKLYSFYDKG